MRGGIRATSCVLQMDVLLNHPFPVLGGGESPKEREEGKMELEQAETETPAGTGAKS